MNLLLPLAVATALTTAQQATAAVYVQVSGDTDGDAVPEVGAPGYDPAVKCMHLAAGDGFSTMADGKVVYGFRLFRCHHRPSGRMSLSVGLLAANFAAPTISSRRAEGLSRPVQRGHVDAARLVRPAHGPLPRLSAGGVDLRRRADGLLLDQHGRELRYFYNIVEPGTYLYHCHVEATEHMEMGMIGNLWVQPKQNDGPAYAGYTRFAYNDGNGSTVYHEAYPIQFARMDRNFHDASDRRAAAAVLESLERATR